MSDQHIACSVLPEPHFHSLFSIYLEILKVHLKGETMEGVDLTDLARRTNNFSGSDLKNLAVSAALASLKDIIPDMWNSKKTLKKENAKTSSDENKEGDDDTKAKEEEEEDDDDSDSDSDDDEPAIAPPYPPPHPLQSRVRTSVRDKFSRHGLCAEIAQLGSTVLSG